jgi:hypothetical protein
MSKGIPFFSNTAVKEASKKGAGVGLLDFGKRAYDIGADSLGAIYDIADKNRLNRLKGDKTQEKEANEIELAIQKRKIEDLQRNKDINEINLEDKGKTTRLESKDRIVKNLATNEVKRVQKLPSQLETQGTQALEGYKKQLKDSGDYSDNEINKYVGEAQTFVSNKNKELAQNETVLGQQNVNKLASTGDVNPFAIDRANQEFDKLQNKKVDLKRQLATNQVTEGIARAGKEIGNFYSDAVGLVDMGFDQTTGRLANAMQGKGFIPGNEYAKQQEIFKARENALNNAVGPVNGQEFYKGLDVDQSVGSQAQRFVGQTVPFMLAPESQIGRKASTLIASKLRPGLLRNIVKAGISEGFQDTGLSTLQTAGELNRRVQNKEITAQEAFKQAPSLIGTNAIGDFAGAGLMRGTGDLIGKGLKKLRPLPNIPNQKGAIGNLETPITPLSVVPSSKNQVVLDLKDKLAEKRSSINERLADVGGEKLLLSERTQKRVSKLEKEANEIELALQKYEGREQTNLKGLSAKQKAQELANQIKDRQNIPEKSRTLTNTSDLPNPTNNENNNINNLKIFNGVYKPKNQAELETTFKEVFDLNDKQANASSIITDRVLNTIAKRKGITPEQAFSDLGFKKSQLEELQKGAKFQGDLQRRDLTPSDIEIVKTGTLDDVKKLWESGTRANQIMGELGKRFNGIPKKERFSGEFLDYTKQQNRIKQDVGFQPKTIEEPKKTRRQTEDEIREELSYDKEDLIKRREIQDDALYHPKLEKEIPHDQRNAKLKGDSFTITNRIKSASRGKNDTSKSRSNYYVLGDANGKPLENLRAGYMDKSGQWVSNTDVQLRVSDHIPGTTYTPSFLRQKGFLQAKDDLWVNSDGEIAFITHKPTDQMIASFVKSGQWDGFKKLASKKTDLYEAKYKELNHAEIKSQEEKWNDLFQEKWKGGENTKFQNEKGAKLQNVLYQSNKKPKLNEKALQNINNTEPKNLTGKRPNLAEETGDTSIKQVFDNDGSNYNVKYEVLESPDIHASITKDFGNNPKYEFTNTRDRAGNLGLKSQVENMSEGIKPELLSLSNSIRDGSPIIGKNSNSVLSGNGRTAAIQRAYAKGKGTGYKEYLIKNAKEFGLDVDQIKRMKEPVLARRVLDEDVNYQDFIEKANNAGLAQRTPSEQAFADISSLDEADPSAKRFIQKLSDSEKTALIDNKGKLNQYGETRLANAKIAKAFGHTQSGKRLVEKLSNAGDDGIKKISKAMGDNSAGFIKLKNEIKQGKIDKNFDITDDFLNAIEEYVDYKAIKAEIRTSLDEHLGQSDMFTGSSLGDSWQGTFKEGLFRELAKKSRSTTALSKSMKDYLELVESSKNQLDLLGKTKQPHSLLNEAFETDNFRPKTPQPKEKVPDLTRQTDKNIEIPQISQKARGALENSENRKQLIHSLSSPDVSTPLHEIAHVYESVLKSSEKQDILDWAGSKEWDTTVSEKFAEGFEKYLADGKAPIPELQKIFDDFKTWLTEIYKGITGSKIDLKLNKEMRKIYDEMIGAEAKATVSKVPEAPKVKTETPTISNSRTVETLTKDLEDYLKPSNTVDDIKQKKLGTKKVINPDGTERIARTLGDYKAVDFQEIARQPDKLNKLSDISEAVSKTDEEAIDVIADLAKEKKTFENTLVDLSEALETKLKQKGIDPETYSYKGIQLFPTKGKDSLGLNTKGQKILNRYERMLDRLGLGERVAKSETNSLSVQTNIGKASNAKIGVQNSIDALAEQWITAKGDLLKTDKQFKIAKDVFMSKTGSKLDNGGLDHVWKNEKGDTAFHISRAKSEFQGEAKELLNTRREHLKQRQDTGRTIQGKMETKLKNAETGKAMTAASEKFKTVYQDLQEKLENKTTENLATERKADLTDNTNQGTEFITKDLIEGKEPETDLIHEVTTNTKKLNQQFAFNPIAIPIAGAIVKKILGGHGFADTLELVLNVLPANKAFDNFTKNAKFKNLKDSALELVFNTPKTIDQSILSVKRPANQKFIDGFNKLEARKMLYETKLAEKSEDVFKEIQDILNKKNIDEILDTEGNIRPEFENSKAAEALAELADRKREMVEYAEDFKDDLVEQINTIENKINKAETNSGTPTGKRVLSGLKNEKFDLEKTLIAVDNKIGALKTITGNGLFQNLQSMAYKGALLWNPSSAFLNLFDYMNVRSAPELQASQGLGRLANTIPFLGDVDKALYQTLGQKLQSNKNSLLHFMTAGKRGSYYNVMSNASQSRKAGKNVGEWLKNGWQKIEDLDPNKLISDFYHDVTVVASARSWKAEHPEFKNLPDPVTDFRAFKDEAPKEAVLSFMTKMNIDLGLIAGRGSKGADFALGGLGNTELGKAFTPFLKPVYRISNSLKRASTDMLDGLNGFKKLDNGTYEFDINKVDSDKALKGISSLIANIGGTYLVGGSTAMVGLPAVGMAMNFLIRSFVPEEEREDFKNNFNTLSLANKKLLPGFGERIQIQQRNLGEKDSIAGMLTNRFKTLGQPLLASYIQDIGKVTKMTFDSFQEDKEVDKEKLLKAWLKVLPAGQLANKVNAYLNDKEKKVYDLEGAFPKEIGSVKTKGDLLLVVGGGNEEIENIKESNRLKGKAKKDLQSLSFVGRLGHLTPKFSEKGLQLFKSDVNRFMKLNPNADRNEVESKLIAQAQKKWLDKHPELKKPTKQKKYKSRVYQMEEAL